MTEEEKLKALWEIAQEVARKNLVINDRDGYEFYCAFCDGYGGTAEYFNHEADCIVTKARALLLHSPLVEKKGSRMSEEDWNNRFPILEYDMTEEYFKISLSDDKSRLEATLPREQVDAICGAWLLYQKGAASEKHLLGRHYAGLWKKGNN